MKVCLCTCPGDQALALAQRLVEERLAACVNIIGPLKSCYRWKGEIAVDSEAQLLIKTADEVVQRLMERLREIHPYEVPEIVIIAVERASPGYEAWVAAETTVPLR